MRILKENISKNKYQRLWFVFTIIVILFVNFSFSQSDPSSLAIEYRTLTRGSYQLLKLNESTVEVTQKSREKTIDTLKMDRKKWKRIVDMVQNMNLKELPYLEAPSEKRKHDGAAHAKLKIYFKGKIYESSGFDHGNPPDTIKELVEFVVQYMPN